MKTIRFSPLRAAAASLLLGAAASLALVAGAGCESADSYEISVTPAYQEIKPGGSVALTARGWSDYKWALDVDGVGHLNRTTGERVPSTGCPGCAWTSSPSAAGRRFPPPSARL